MSHGAAELDSGYDEYVISRRGEFAVAHPNAEVSACKTCEGRGFVIAVEDGYEVSLTCECRGTLDRIRYYNDACLPADYAEKHISQLKNYKGSNLDSIKLKIMNYMDQRDPASERGFLFYGPPGVGKTHLLCSVVRELTLHKGIACKYVDFFHLSDRIRSCLGDRNEVKPADILEPLVEVPILAIDELGKGMCTPFEIHIIDQLITRRYNATRPVLVTTNYWPERMMSQAEALNVQPGRKLKKIGESLEERTDERIVSRLYEMCDMIEVKGQDYRYGSNA